jgi:SAM-dependent methyltransferase
MNVTEWNIPALLQLSGGYWAACALHTGVKLNLFNILQDNAKTAEEISAKACTNARATGMLLDALTSLNLLVKRGNTYENTTFSAKVLDKNSADYAGHIIMHHHHLMEGWSKLSEAVTIGGPVRGSSSHADDDMQRESFLMGMFNLASLIAPLRAATIDLSSCRSLLDLGGGPGTYAIHFCKANPQLTATIFDLSTTRKFAEDTVQRFNLVERINFISGDYHVNQVPSGFDAAWLSHVIHSEDAQGSLDLLRKGVDALDPGGILMVQEFIMNNTKSGRPFPALFSLNMLLGTKNGQAYSEAELKEMMEAAGLSEVVRLNLDLPNGAGVMQGRKL